MATEKKTLKAFGWAARDSSCVFSPFNFTRRASEEHDVTIKILYCGICHSDLHLARNEVGLPVSYPLVPGHEIAGEVIETGPKVSKFRPGDKAGVGCFVRSCGTCENCEQDLESYCSRSVFTYGGIDYDGAATHGGYSDVIVVPERYVFRMPESLPLHAAAPLLCAGITVYSPMRYFGLDRPGLHVGVVGLGGLGHVAVRFAKAMGMKVTVISTSPEKEKEAVEVFGADRFIVSRNEELMKAATGSMDGIIDTVAGWHPVAPLIELLKAHGKLVALGAAAEPWQVPPIALLIGRKLVAGSAAGGMKETQEMLDFAAAHGITAEVEIIPMDYVNAAMDRLARGDVRYRFVIDIANTLKAN
ncbi:putative mannitol dehydrogenase [Apostasia shenzhenica]|uniref:cinnamyl-alcohol dehydrogenase n=1 Tax=Apostasia shenzhenica TaxID=1088818 RepID=A0A2I0B389_9ASPA|nr:putative mannitol dehydrogenase [Apostasia shenzhenica]